jgi:predicted metal-dependent hydrolase
MRRDELRAFFEHSPTVRLLRSDLAPWILAFLHATFKTDAAIAIGQSELRSRLATFQDDVHETYPEVMTGSPERYVAQWTESLWLRRFVESNSSEPQYQLSAAAEEAIHFVEEALSRRQNMVGTEGRLRMIIDTLQDIVRGASDDPERRLEFLNAQRKMLEKEISAIESGKSVQVYRPSQIRERFQNAINLLRELQSDFRAVEDRFQEIARRVQHLQAAGHETRGMILGFALDAEETLKQEDEGVSFYAFVRFLLSPTEQMSLRKSIEEIQQLAALADQQEGLQRLHRMVPSLLAEADKVMRTTARLSATLRRLLDSRSAEHRVRLANVLHDIRKAALQLRTDPPSSIALNIDAEIDIQAPLERPFWTAQPDFIQSEIHEHITDLTQAGAIASAFAKMHRLDLRKLRETIRERTLDGHEWTLKDLWTASPSSMGIVDLLGYIQIAHDDEHPIDPMEQDVIEWESPNRPGVKMRARVPRITFVPKAASRPFGRKPR